VVAEDLWRIDDGGERDDAPAGTRRSEWALVSWSGGRAHQIAVTWLADLEGLEELAPEGSGVAESLADPPGRRGLSAVLRYLPAENPPAEVRLTEDGLQTTPRWIPLGAPTRAEPLQGKGWAWNLQGPDGRATVVVVEDPGLTGGRGLPKAVRDARSSKGRSALAPLLDRPRLPARIRLDDEGVHAEAGGEGSGDAG